MLLWIQTKSIVHLMKVIKRKNNVITLAYKENRNLRSKVRRMKQGRKAVDAIGQMSVRGAIMVLYMVIKNKTSLWLKDRQ